MNHLQKLYKTLNLLYLINKNKCIKLFLSLESPTKFYEIFKVALVPFLIPD